MEIVEQLNDAFCICDNEKDKMKISFIVEHW